MGEIWQLLNMDGKGLRDYLGENGEDSCELIYVQSDLHHLAMGSR